MRGRDPGTCTVLIHATQCFHAVVATIWGVRLGFTRTHEIPHFSTGIYGLLVSVLDTRYVGAGFESPQKLNFNLYIFPLCQCGAWSERKVPDLKGLYDRFPKLARDFVTTFLRAFRSGTLRQGLYKLGTLCYKGLYMRGLYVQDKIIGILALGDS